jgi:hypothetical protein
MIRRLLILACAALAFVIGTPQEAKADFIYPALVTGVPPTFRFKKWGQAP